MHSFRKHRRRSVGFAFPVHAVAFSGLLSLLEQNTPLIWCPEPQVLEHLLQELTYEYIKNKYALNVPPVIFFFTSRHHFRVPVTNFCVTCYCRTLHAVASVDVVIVFCCCSMLLRRINSCTLFATYSRGMRWYSLSIISILKVSH